MYSSGDCAETGCGSCTPLEQTGWYCGNAEVEYAGCRNRTSIGGPACNGVMPVAQKTANTFGLYDMHGNVWESVWDRWDGDYLAGPQTDPLGPESGDRRVMRGGCFYVEASFGRSAQRMHPPPTSQFFGLGFRVARTTE